MVNNIKAEALYPLVQSQGVCARECLVLDNFATMRSMFL